MLLNIFNYNDKVNQYGLIGNPVDHSRSPELFNSMFKRENIGALYDAFRLNHISDLPELIISKPSLIGLNVTSPFKEEVIPFLTTLTYQAQKVGAVNTIFIDRTSTGEVKLIGHNSDVIGVKNLLSPFNLADKSIYVLGTGGASKAVSVALQEYGFDFQIVSRSPGENTLSYHDFNLRFPLSECVIINATPVGMGCFKDKKPDIDYDKISPTSIGIDLIYSPSETPFLREFLERGASVRNGYAMLLGQAAESWYFWQKCLSER